MAALGPCPAAALAEADGGRDVALADPTFSPVVAHAWALKTDANTEVATMNFAGRRNNCFKSNLKSS